MRHLLLTLTLIWMYSINAQVAPGKYWIEFTDKHNSPFSLLRPEEFLSSRAMERRQKQNIPIKENDLPVSPAYVQQLSSMGLQVLYTSKWLNACVVSTSDTALIYQAGMLPFVKDALRVARYKEPDRQKALLDELMMMLERDIAKRLQELEEKKPITKTLSSEKFDYARARNQITMLNGDQLHHSGYAGEGMLIAVFDAGFPGVDTMQVFREMIEAGRLKGTYDFVDMDEMVFDADRHGMNVLSTMAAKMSGIMTGSAPHADYWLIRTEDAKSEFLIEECNWVRAIEFADSIGVDVVNSSLGYTTFDDASMNHTYASLDGKTTLISRAATIAASKGILVVNSAGNSGDSEWRYIGAPADADSILSIGATDAEGRLASFSSRGPTADGRIKPNVSAQGKGTIVADLAGGTIAANGTSFSAPIISGLAACLWQANPDKSAQQIIKAIEQSASQYESPDFDLGYGIPNFALADKLLKGIKPEDINRDSIVNVFPNPFNSGLTIEFYSASAQNVEVIIANVNGKVMKKQVFSAQAFANNRFEFSRLENLNDAAYVIKIHTGTRSFARTLVKKAG